MKLDCVVFDFDNTLVPTTSGRPALFLAALREWNAELTEDFLEHHWSATFRDVVADCAPSADYEIFLERYAQLLRKNPLAPYPCALSLLSFLRDEGVESWVFTATAHVLAVTDMETSGIQTLVSQLIAAEDVRYPKPDLRAADDLIHQLDLSNFSPDHCIFVGDSQTDRDIAERAGLTFFAVTTGRTRRVDFLNSGIRETSVFSSLCDIGISLRILTG